MTLLMRDRENIEKGMEIGVIGLIFTLKELNMSNDFILKKLQERFNINIDEAYNYLKKAENIQSYIRTIEQRESVLWFFFCKWWIVYVDVLEGRQQAKLYADLFGTKI